MVEPFAATAYALQVGEVSGIVETTVRLSHHQGDGPERGESRQAGGSDIDHPRRTQGGEAPWRARRIRGVAT